MVQTLPERDEVSQTKEQMLAMLAMAMGGRAAEELVFGEDMTTSGAASDIQMATQIARAMVTKLGFSTKLGQVAYEPLEQPQFAIDNHAEKTRETIDDEVKALVADAYLKAKCILRDRRADLDRLADAVLKYETITGEEIKAVIAGGEIRRTA
jgi:cell division protease FtsH